MPQSLESLKKKRDGLLRKAKARKSLMDLSKVRELERKRIKAEIFALENPKSIKARKILRSTSGKVGRFLKKRASVISQNLERIAREDEKKRRPMRKKKTVRRKRRRSR